MLDQATRTAILRLAAEGHSERFIARTIGASRGAVIRVLKSQQAEVPALERGCQCSPHRARIEELNRRCRGNLVRVHEELAAAGIEIAYSTLTRFCLKNEIGGAPKQAAGQYTFGPAKEMQHDTSPHTVEVGGRDLPLQCASLILCFSRRRFIQCYRRWNRFLVKVFLTRAIQFFDGAADQCMLDNSTVIMTGGTGKNARPVPEMKAFSDRFGFQFVAHEVGDANRSARVEGPFFHVENNFYAGRTFSDLADLNSQLLTWCKKYNSTYHSSFRGVPDELYAIERPLLKPLPPYIPEPTDVHVRRVDVEGYVRLHVNKYSAPEALIGRSVEVHETFDRVRIFDGHRQVADHGRREDGLDARVTLPEHRGRWKRLSSPPPPSPEEATLRANGVALAALCDRLRESHGGQSLRAMRQLLRIWRDYPNEAVLPAVARALEFGLTDLNRIERMVLRKIRGDFFNLPIDPEDEDG